jgi:hypothetical protein
MTTPKAASLLDDNAPEEQSGIMTSWPWMKGVDVAVADPIPLVNEYDERPSVKDLISENRKIIDQMKQELQSDPLYVPDKHDDLWILRFLLSHKKHAKVALKAAKTTLAFRMERKLDERDIRAHPVGKNCKDEAVAEFSKHLSDDAITFGVPDVKRGVIGFFRYAGIDQHALVNNLDESFWLSTFCYVSEWSFQWTDYVTRTTGRLTKSVRIMDMEGFSISSISNENMKRDGAAMAVMEDCYPQLLQGIFICDPPIWIQIPWRIFRPLLPKRVVNKIDFIVPLTRKKERMRLFKHISEDNLPARFGGKYEIWPVEFHPPVVG